MTPNQPLKPIYLLLSGFFFFLAYSSAFAGMDRPIEHQLVIDLKPQLGQMTVEDTLTLYPGKWTEPSLVFLLHGEFELSPVEIPHNGDWAVTVTRSGDDKKRHLRIEIAKPEIKIWPDFLQLKFNYQGPYRDLQAGDTISSKTPHTIFLDQNSLFYPVLETSGTGPLVTFLLETVTPSGWQVVSQGKRVTHIRGEGPVATTWKCDDPMENIYLIADRYHEYKDRWEDIDLLVFLREDEPELAQRYLDTAKLYIPFYQRLIGAYPFVKFAVVENSEQTGYGMPSFTLLGSQVIRFPFILHTSFPHEILHNWWGNGVFVDPDSGNWSEGLTTYLADHLFPQLKGKGPSYRFQELMKYKNYVTPANDFPLNQFTSRHDMATQAIGYGKWLMVLHMLKNKIGDKAFLDGLHDFYFQNLFKRASFDDLRKMLEETSGEQLKPFFDQWITRKGAPSLELAQAKAVKNGNDYDLKFEATQVQSQGEPKHVYKINLPVAVWLEGEEVATMQTIALEKSRQKFTLHFPKIVQALSIDPWHEVFRRLNDGEIPPSIGQTYGDKEAEVSIANEEPGNLASAYTSFAEHLNASISTDDSSALKNDEHAQWIFGRTHPAGQELIHWLNKKGIVVKKQGVQIEGKLFSFQDHSFALTVPHPTYPAQSVTWLILHSPNALPGLMRKLPHYGKYGYLVFKGDAPTNVSKGVWPANRTRLVHQFQEGLLTLPAPKPLVNFTPFD